MTQPVLSIIIVSYNSAELTLKTLESVARDIHQSASLRSKTEIWIIDNASTDQSVSRIRNWQKQQSSDITIQLVENAENVGFARANNHALTTAQGRYLLLLNSDTIVRPGALEKLVATFEHEPINETTAELSSYAGRLDKLGILAASLLNPDGTPQAQGGSFPTLGTLATHMLMLDDLPLIGSMLASTQHTGRRATSKQKQTHPIIQKDWVGGTAMMIRREVIADIGMLDPAIFMYGEDIEYCLRARHHNWDVAINQIAEIEHFGSGSSSPMRAIMGELSGYIYIWSKHKPHWQLPLAKSLLVAGSLLRIFIFGTILHNSTKAEPYRRWLREMPR